jgi:hypothetical protein
MFWRKPEISLCKNGILERLFTRTLIDCWNNKWYIGNKEEYKWTKIGDDNTKFFHANATVKHNKSTIRSLKGNNGVELFKHEEKVATI